MGFRCLLAQGVETRSRWHWTIPITTLLASSSHLTGSLGDMAIAQIVPDETLPNNSVISENGSISTITGGTQSGNYLFHSFETFSILDNRTATFDHATAIDSIVTRVTGGAESRINGILEAQGTTNFFLLNPNGIFFGADAQLNIGGAFIGSSADRFIFEDSSVFSAVDPQSPPLLIVNSSIGLQYGSAPGRIEIQGNGSNLTLDDETFDVILSDRPDGLQVHTDQTLALIGGDVVVDGGNLTAVSGRIILGGAKNGTVTLTNGTDGWHANYQDVATFRNLDVSGSASILTSGAGGGDIQINGRTIRITGGSGVLANTLETDDAVGITIQASDLVHVNGASLNTDGDVSFPTSIFSEVSVGASGSGGDITIQSPRLRVTDGAQISASTLGDGDAGNISVMANRVNVFGGAGLSTPSGLFVNVLDVNATGQGGSLSIMADRLDISGGAEISANTFGGGHAGAINLEVAQVNVIAGAAGLGSSGIFAQADLDSTGNGGSIFIESDRLQITGGGTISIGTLSSGSAGVAQISTDSLILDGQSPGGIPSTISAVASTPVDPGATTDQRTFTGQGGEIDIRANHLQLLNGAQLTTSTFNDGNGGSIRVEAQDIVVVGEDNTATIIASSVEEESTGEGGTILLITDTLQVLNGGQIGSSTEGDGQAGHLTIQAQTIEITGRNNLARSGLFASAILGNGTGGDLSLETDDLIIQDGALLSASNFLSRNPTVQPGQGPAGNIHVRANHIQLKNGGEITTSTAVGEQGNIGLHSNLIVLSDRSVITTNANAATGGNINIDAGTLVGLNNSDITANAMQGRGGRVAITADSILGLQFRRQITNQSDITATSSLGPQFDGVVELNTPDVDPLQGTFELPIALRTPNTEITSSCEPVHGNELILTGRGGLPTTANQLTSGSALWPDLRLVESDAIGSESVPPSPRLEGTVENSDGVRVEEQAHSSHPVEAQDWQIGTSGHVHLVARSHQLWPTQQREQHNSIPVCGAPSRE